MTSMRKFSFLLSTLGGAIVGYLASNKKLRMELTKANSAEAAGKVFARHLQSDGKQIGKALKDFVESDKMQSQLTKAKSLVQHQFHKAEKELQSLVRQGEKGAKDFVTRTLKKAEKAAVGTMKKKRFPGMKK